MIMRTLSVKRLLVALLAAPLAALALHGGAQASEAGYRLDPAPIDPNDQVSLQSGVRTFVNYCLNCHGAQFMRYNRLQDIGLTDQQIKDKLLFTADKVGETMKIAMTTADGKAWFGVAPPDLTVIARDGVSLTDRGGGNGPPSLHGGLSDREMLVPLLMARLDG